MIYIEDTRYQIRNFNQEDLDDVYEYGSDSIVAYMVTWSAHRSKKETEVILHSFINDPLNFAIYDKIDKKVIGSISLMKGRECTQDFKSEKAIEVGYVLNRKYQNKGVMTFILSLLIKKLIEEKEYTILVATSLKENKASLKVLEKNSFIQYKIQQDYYWKNADKFTEHLFFYRRLK